MPLDEVAIRMPISEIDKMKMLNNNVLIEVFDTRNEIGGIKMIITQDNPFVPESGMVYKKPDSEVCFNVGDCVIIEKYKGRRVYATDENRQFILMDASHVLAIAVSDDVLQNADNETAQRTLEYGA